MLTWLLSRKNKPGMTLGAALALLLILVVAPAPAQKSEPEKAAGPALQASPAPGNIEIAGKLFCSLKRSVPLPFKAVITELLVHTGQQVQAGEVLARYRLSPEAVMGVEKRLSPSEIRDLEIKSVENQKTLRDLETKQGSLKQLVREKMAPSERLAQVDRDVALTRKQQTAIAENLAQARRLAQEDREVLSKQLGGAAGPGKVPREGVMVAPITGTIIWVLPDLRVGAELNPGPAVFQVGQMDPMLIRARVHEIEAQRLSLGDTAEVTVESVPGRKFEARLSRLSWAPLEPALDLPTYYEVEFTLPNPDLILKEGLKARLVLHKTK